MDLRWKWAFKVVRDTNSGMISVTPVFRVPPEASPFRLKYVPKEHLAEGMLVFDSEEEAEKAREYETAATELAQSGADAMRKAMQNSLCALQKYRVHLMTICLASGVPYPSARQYLSGLACPNPRIAYKFLTACRMILESMERVQREAESILPGEGIAGNPRMGRGGRPDIYKERRPRRPRNAEDNSGL